MRKRHAGSHFGSSETLRLRRKMAQLTETEPPQKRQRRSHKAGTPTWGQIKNLLTQATDVVMASGREVTATHVFLACLCILTTTGESALYWAYMVGPPTVQPVTWRDPTPIVYTNLTFMGGEDAGFLPTVSASINWTALSAGVPICLQRESMPYKLAYGCLGTKPVGRSITYTMWQNDKRLSEWVPRSFAAYWQKRELLGEWMFFGPHDPPQNLPICPSAGQGLTGDSPWGICAQSSSLRMTPKDINYTITDYSRKARLAQSVEHETLDPRVVDPPPSEVQVHHKIIPQTILQSPEGRIHSDLWKLYATFDKIYTNDSFSFPEYYVSPVLQLRACVPPPYYLIVGDGTITPVKEDGHQLYRLTCPACVLTNCLPVDGPSRSGMKVYLVLQPPYWMLPVYVTGPWYPNYGMQLALEISKRLRRTKRFLGLLIVGLIATVTVIASATVSVISLHESAQMASHVNELAHNVSKVFATQERIDRKLEAQLEALQEALMYLGDQFAVLRTRLSLICHDAYKHICVTPLEYTNVTWGQVRRHLQGVWHDANTSLDLLQLQEEINAVASSSLSFPDPGDLAETILHQLNGFNPFNILQHSFWIFIGIVSVISVILVLLCYFWRWGLTAFTTYQARMHMLQLQTIGGHVGGRALVPG
ncbi:endogenous retrovirus group K member 6 Env polyprotein-like [Panthera pardus]|uniref:Endogenous retrovirus group K member 6 Env polyprotein-like n=1 Tax=Panthera pardus TaxID=9691 RepID=A0A9V1F882_PANPR|nr:endogenous retrovirus group K member 6 Env polyprotein-like [Panthera pardus]